MILNNFKFQHLNSNNISYFLFCLIPIGLVFSVFVADFSLVVICLIFLYLNFTRKENYFDNYFIKIFLFFWIIIVLRSIFSEDVFFSLKSSLSYIRFGIFVLAIKYILEKNLKNIYFFFILLLFLLLLVSLDGIIQFFAGKNLLGYEYLINEKRISGFFKDELIIGSFVSRLTPVLIGTYFYCLELNFIKKIREFNIFLVSVFLFILVILSGERVSILYFSITFIFLFFFIETKLIKKLLVLLFLITLMSFIFFKFDNIKQRLYNITLQQIGILMPVEAVPHKIYFFSIHHHNHAIASLKIFKENILFGSGVKMFRKICDKRYNVNAFTCTTHPHNLILQFLAETGIIGIFFYLLSLFLLIKKMLKIIKKKMQKIKINYIEKGHLFFMIALLIALFPIFPSGNFFNNWLSIVTYLPLGFYFVKIKNNINA